MTGFTAQQNYILQLLKSCGKRTIIVKFTKDGPAHIAIRTFATRELAKYSVPFPFDEIKNTTPAKLNPNLDPKKLTIIIREAIADYLDYFLDEYGEDIPPGQKLFIDTAIDDIYDWINEYLPGYSDEDLEPFVEENIEENNGEEEVDTIETKDQAILEALKTLQSFGHTRIKGYEDVERILWDLAYRHMNLTTPMMRAILTLTTEIKVKTATKRMFNRFNSLIERNRMGGYGMIEVGIRQNYMRIGDHENEINQLKHQLKKTEGRVLTEQRTKLKPKLKLSEAFLKKIHSPKSRFVQSYDFTKEEDVDEFIEWYRISGFKVKNYLVNKLTEQYGEEKLTMFKEKVNEYNSTLKQSEQEEEQDAC